MTDITPGPTNLITDVAGIKVGNAEDAACLTGVTAIIPDHPVVAAADVRGGAPGTRDVALLDPACLVEHIHGIVLSGGSVFGLDAAGGVIAELASRGIGFTFTDQPQPCPVVPSAILFDLVNGGDKDWGDTPPYRALGAAACAAAGSEFALGNAGAGLGATAGNLKGGLGSASAVIDGITVGALVAVNSFGSAVDPRTGDLWAAPFELNDEFGGRRSLAPGTPASTSTGTKMAGACAGANTTIAIVATDAVLTRGEAGRLAIMATDGMARALRPVHAPFDGDTVFAVATGKAAHPAMTPITLTRIGTAAADTLTRAIGRALYEATSIPGHPSWREATGA
ncbi:MAG: P1 family peptidase [Rhizobiales bacterium]|nr:P1 family peptidase [Hyphomicrobiales bacterium]